MKGNAKNERGKDELKRKRKRLKIKKKEKIRQGKWKIERNI